MAVVSVNVFGRSYQLACAEGEEDRLTDLAAEMDERLIMLSRQMPGAGEHMLMVMSGLTMIDELRDAKESLRGAQKAIESASQKMDTAQNAQQEERLNEIELVMAQTLEEVAQRIEKIAQQLEMR